MNENQSIMAKENKDTKPVSIVLVGAGNRGSVYSEYAKKEPDNLKVVGIVEPDKIRRESMAKEYDVAPENCFDSIESFTNGPKIADAALNATMDKIHIETTIPLLKAGYDVLLEKPIGITKEEVVELLEAQRKYDRKVMVCHVLRYAPFYVEIKKRVSNGDIGEIMNIQTTENVSYHHMAVSYIRGKWNSKEKCKSSMLMAKCCHDLDIITWLMGGTPPVKTNSYGSLMYFKPENAPEGAGKRCLVDCEIEDTCPFSARKNYVDDNQWDHHAWTSIEHISLNPTKEQKLESLKKDNPYGRCVWHCDNDVVDHQSVVIEFEGGATATHNMVGGTPKPDRKIHIIGTKGEIVGSLADGTFVVRHPDADDGLDFNEEKHTIDVQNDMHGGGDMGVVEDFVRMVRGKEASISTTSLEDSIYGHLIGFIAEDAREQNKVLSIEQL